MTELDISFFYFWHETLNRIFFDGKLEAVIFKFYQDEEELAHIDTELEPFLIQVNESLLTKDEYFVITVILHEMIHQYSRENCIEDIDEFGEHNENFKHEATNHGLIMNGYKLTRKAKDIISPLLECYNVIKGI